MATNMERRLSSLPPKLKYQLGELIFIKKPQALAWGDLNELSSLGEAIYDYLYENYD